MKAPWAAGPVCAAAPACTAGLGALVSLGPWQPRNPRPGARESSPLLLQPLPTAGESPQLRPLLLKKFSTRYNKSLVIKRMLSCLLGGGVSAVKPAGVTRGHYMASTADFSLQKQLGAVFSVQNASVSPMVILADWEFLCMLVPC